MTNKVVQDFEAAIEKLGGELASDVEKLIAELMKEGRALFISVANDPKVLAAIQVGGTIVVDAAVGAAEAGGPGAIAGAIKGVLPGVLEAASIPAESAAASFVEATLKAKIEEATAATPTKPNP